MAIFRVGCVPYVNARPLVEFLDSQLVEVAYEVPSKLPSLLKDGSVDAILVSSVEYLKRTDLRILAEPCIASFGAVRSVRLLSKVPLIDIQTLALDSSSMTSNLLAQVVLAEQGVFPLINVASPDADEMLNHFDACVIIGDRGFEATGEYAVDLDLGEAWTNLTGLPFVWALWLAGGDLNELGEALTAAFRVSGFGSASWPKNRQKVIESAAKQSGWTTEDVENYLTDAVVFEIEEVDVVLQTFSRLLNKHRLI